jgi:hypothetical protein
MRAAGNISFLAIDEFCHFNNPFSFTINTDADK